MTESRSTCRLLVSALDSYARTSANAKAAILNWSADAELVNTQRAAVERAGGLPISARALRDWIQPDAEALNAPPPSMNQVRRRLGWWFKHELRERLGPIYPPQDGHRRHPG